MSDWGWLQSVPEWVKIVSVGLIGLIVGKFLPSYITEKGKNVATKEDVGQITMIIEATKNDLGILREEITSTRVRGDNALREFFENCHALESILGTFPRISALTFREDMDQYYDSIHRLFDDIILSQRRLLLYSHGDDKIIKQSEKIASVCPYLISVAKKQFSSVDNELKNHIYEFLNQEEAYDVLIEQIGQGHRSYAEAIKNPLGEFSFALAEYTYAMSEYFRNKYKSS